MKLTLTRGLQFSAEDDYGHNVIIDTDKEFGGFDQGFRPAELLLVSLAGCMSMDIVGILKKKGGTIDSFETLVQTTRAEKHPKQYEKIHLKFICKGEYKQKDLERALELSREKYCSVLATLNNTPKIEFEV